jgi:hypothetical protein
VAFEHQSEAGREQDVAIFGSFASVDENLAAVQINVADFNAGQFADPNGGVEQQLK